jgi:CBS domain containing-hemolysin-like protein
VIEEILFRVAAIFGCIVLSALFSGSETALTGFHHGRLAQLISRNRPGTGMLKAWRDRPATVLSFLLIANNLVNILASSLATELSLNLMDELGMGFGTSAAIAVSVGVMTLLILTFGEVLPKTYARHNPMVLLPLFPFLQVLYYLLWPAARTFARLGRGFIRLTGGDLASPPPTITGEELQYLIEKGTVEGSLDEEKEQLLSGALDLENTIVREVMIPRTDVVMFEASDSQHEVMEIINRKGFSRYPVYQASPDKVIGFVHVKDLLTWFRQPEKGRRPFRLRDFVRPPYFVPETKPLDTLLREFKAERIHIAIVVDEYGGTAGLVTMEDVIEELVGEIYDEHDREQRLHHRVDDHTWIVHAKLPVDELTDELEIPVNFPEDREYETVGGLVMELAESVPRAGATFEYPAGEEREGPPILRFSVLESDGVKLGKIRLEWNKDTQ